MNIEINAPKRIEELKELFGKHIFNYLLYWKKDNEAIIIRHFKSKKLFEMTNEEYISLFEFATAYDLKHIKGKK